MKTRDALELLLLSAIWGASFLLISLAVRGFPPAWVALLRLTFGAALLWSVLLSKRGKLPPFRILGTLLLVALANNAIPFLLFPLGEQVVPSNIAAVLNATTPIWSMLLTIAFLGKRAEGRLVPGVILGFLGVMVVVFSHPAGATPASRREYLLGIVYIAVASASYAVASVLAKARLSGFDPVGLATAQLSLAGMMILPAALLGPHPGAILLGPLAAAITLGLLGSGLAYLMFYRLLARVSSTQVVSVTYFGPVWGLFWGWLAHEQIRPLSIVGVAIVLSGLLLMNRDPKQHHARQMETAR